MILLERLIKAAFSTLLICWFSLLFTTPLLANKTTSELNQTTDIFWNLTPEEVHYIEQHKNITYAAYEMGDLLFKKGDKYEGIIKDYLNLIKEKTGLGYVFVDVSSFKEAKNKYDSREVEGLPGIQIKNSITNRIALTESYLEFPVVIVTKNNISYIKYTEELDGYKVASTKSFIQNNYFQAKYPDIKLTSVSTLEDALRLLKNDRVDAVIGNYAIIMELLSNPIYRNMKISGVTEFDLNYHIGINFDNKIAISIINKALKNITDRERQDIYQRWFGLNHVDDFNLNLLFKVIIGLAACLLVIFLWNRKLTALNSDLNSEITQRRRMEKVHRSLYKIALSVTEVSSIEEFYVRLHNYVNDLMFANNFFIALYDGESNEINFPYFVDEFDDNPGTKKLGKGLSDYVIRTGVPLIIRQEHFVDFAREKNVEVRGPLSDVWIGVPLKSEDKVIGLIAVQSYDKKQHLDEKDLNILMFLSFYMVLALDRLELLEEKRVQQRDLVESNDRFRRLFDDSSDAILLVDGRHIVECNTAAYKIFGKKNKQELIGLSQPELSPKFQGDGILTSVKNERIIEDYYNNSIDQYEWTYLREDGTIFPAEVIVTPITYEGNNIIHIVVRDIAERKKAEQALIEREIKYRALFDFASDAVILMDINEQFVSANPRAIDMFRCESEEHFKSLNVQEFMIEKQPDGRVSRDVLNTHIDIALREGGSQYETVAKRIDGSTFYLDIRIRSLVVDGTVLLQGTLRDITSRKESEKNLERSLSLLNATIESSVDGIFAVDTQGKIIAYNSRFADMWGLSEKNIEQGNITEVFTTISSYFDYGEYNDCHLWNYSHNSDAIQSLDLNLTDDRVIKIYSSPQRLGDSIVGRVWNFRDITSRRKSEMALTESHRRLNEIIEFLPDPTMVVDKDGVVVAWNKAIEELTNVDKSFMIGKGYKEYAIPFYGIRTSLLIDYAMSKEPNYDNDIYDFIHREGEMVYGEVFTPKPLNGEGAYIWGAARPLRNSEGEIVGGIECMRNVTARRKAAEELQKAKIEAEEATKTKSLFLANMSHEIRTPMNSILGFGHLLLGTKLDRTQCDYIDSIMNSTESLLNIIDNILDFSKIEAGKLDIEKVQFDLDELTEKILSMLGVIAHAKGLELILNIDPAVPHVFYGDPLRLEQILVNLLNNGIKFTNQGEVSLNISLVDIKESVVKLKIEVKDSGIGLSEESVESLFRPFSQADISTTRKYGGTGLGLAITQKLINALGSQIAVDSVEGQGCTFHFELCLDLVEEQPSYIAEENVNISRALLLESNDVRADFISSTLAKYNISTIREKTLDAFLKGIKSDKYNGNIFQIALLECENNCDSSVANIKKMLSETEMKDASIVLMRKKEVDDDFLKAIHQAGVTFFIKKPVTRLSLYNVISKNNENSIEVAETQKEITLNDFSSSPKVLLVEDNVLNQQVAVKMLEKIGLDVTVADNGRKAIESLWEQNFDIIFMDIQMPEMDGLTATRLIKSDPRFKNIPIIAMTAHAMVSDKDESLQAGMNEHITKPVKPIDLHKIVSKYTNAPLQEIEEDESLKVESLEDLQQCTSDSLNVSKGLSNLGGNKKCYYKILRGFKADYCDFYKRLKASYDDKNFKDVDVLIHTLKGVSGNIGATFLYDICKKLSSGIIEHDSVKYVSILNQIETEIINICKCLDGEMIFEDPEIVEVSDVINKPKALVLIKSLSKMLEEGDADSYDLYTELKSLVGDIKYNGALKNIGVKIENFDFEDALANLQEFGKKLKSDFDGALNE